MAPRLSSSQSISGAARVMPSHADYANCLFDSGSFSDCTICSHDRIWHLHRAILAQRCDFFRACFSSNFRESSRSSEASVAQVEMYDDESEAVGRMLRWLYTLEYPVLEGVQTNDVAGDRLSVVGGQVDEIHNQFGSSSRRWSTSSSTPKHKTHSPDGISTATSSVKLPVTFWSSELSLFITADKYDLPDLADQASASICNTATSIPWSPDLDSTVETFPGSFDDFVDMLERLYVDLSSSSPSVRQLQVMLLHCSAMMIASHASQQARLASLVASVPEFAQDLVEALRRTVEAHAAGKGALSDLNDMDESSSSSHRPLSGLRYRSGSESDASARLPMGGAANRRGRAEKVYIPMNEDSDGE